MSLMLSTAVLAALDACDQLLNDPFGTGNGEDAIAPTGEHYNALQTVIRDVLANHAEPPTGSPVLLRTLLHNYPEIRRAFASCGYKFGITHVLEHALTELCDGTPSATIPATHLKALVAAAESHAEDLTSGLNEGIYEEGRETLPPLNDALQFASAALRISHHAIYDQAIVMAYGKPFDPALVRIDRKRRSTTQGEAEVFYDGQRIEQWFDKIEMQADGQYAGYPDSYWIEAAHHWLANQAILALREKAA